jgi:hypothetical protein
MYQTVSDHCTYMKLQNPYFYTTIYPDLVLFVNSGRNGLIKSTLGASFSAASGPIVRWKWQLFCSFYSIAKTLTSAKRGLPNELLIGFFSLSFIYQFIGTIILCIMYYILYVFILGICIYVGIYMYLIHTMYTLHTT